MLLGGLTETITETLCVDLSWKNILRVVVQSAVVGQHVLKNKPHESLHLDLIYIIYYLTHFWIYQRSTDGKASANVKLWSPTCKFIKRKSSIKESTSSSKNLISNRRVSSQNTRSDLHERFDHSMEHCHFDNLGNSSMQHSIIILFYFTSCCLRTYLTLQTEKACFP